jgi:hypothetical protein
MALNLSISKITDEKVTLENLNKLKVGQQLLIHKIYISAKSKFKRFLTEEQIVHLETVLTMKASLPCSLAIPGAPACGRAQSCQSQATFR